MRHIAREDAVVGMFQRTAAQLVQDLEPVLLQVPVGQGVGLAELRGQNDPAGQRMGRLLGQ